MYPPIEAVSTVSKYLTYLLPAHMLYSLFDIALRIPSISKEEKSRFSVNELQKQDISATILEFANDGGSKSKIISNVFLNHSATISSCE